MSIENVKIDYKNTEIFLEWVEEVSFFVDRHGRQGYELALTDDGIEALGVDYLTIYEDDLDETAIAMLETF